MTTSHALFEISWEVCNKIGGIHTVLSSKARTAVEQFGDDYVVVGPWLLSDTDRELPFDDDDSMADFADACRRNGLPVRVGRWRVSGRPWCILVEFSSLYDRRDEILTRLWDDYRVDSIQGAWDYVEPVLFGEAAATVIGEWYDRYLAPFHRRTVVQAHEWVTGSALLALKSTHPNIGTVFTAHATALGRQLATVGRSLEPDTSPQKVEELAREQRLVAMHSLEGVAVREADVFTTISEFSGQEAQILHGRAPDPVTPNGIDLVVVDELAGPAEGYPAIRERLQDFARRFLGLPSLDSAQHGEAALLCVTGRYEFHNKGLDLLIDTMARLDAAEGRPLVLFVFVPCGNSGMRREVRERLDGPAPTEIQDPIGLSTHHLFDEDADPIQERCRQLGLDNAPGARVKIIQVPVYLGPHDGFLGVETEAAVAAMDLTVFPSFYEPWGYTPQESLAVGVPTITSDYAGFGRWALDAGLDASAGIHVLRRVGVGYEQARDQLAAAVEEFLGRHVDDPESFRLHCRETASHTAWADLYGNYESAYETALQSVALRVRQTPRPSTPPPRPPVRLEPSAGNKPRLAYFDVAATLPTELKPLERLAKNLWWCWDPEAPALFRELSPQGWAASGHNPVRFLRRAYPEDLAVKAKDQDYVARVQRVVERFDAYIAARTERLPIGQPTADDPETPALTAHHPVAYFCAEYGLHESLPIYSGGLGVLAGDHLKSASDRNIPFVAIGLFYHMGYMAQQLSVDGQQIAVDKENIPQDLAMSPVLRADGTQVEVRVPLPGRDLALRAWSVEVGRVTCYLLDANCPSNRPEDRDITRNLYGGDQEMRIKQLIALGRGGVRLLAEIDIEPAVFHMNEGHAAFLTLERVARLTRQEGTRFDAAREWVRASTAFTTHTPVPAGHDRFPEELMRRYFSDVAEWAGVPWDRFLGFGRAHEGEHEFNMTYLALSFSSFCNGVSKLHGIASQELLHPYWPSLLEDEVPIASVTNGIHLATWTHPRIAALLGVADAPVGRDAFRNQARSVPVEQLWQARQDNKLALKEKIEERVRTAFVGRNDSPILLNKMLDGLDEHALWIGFARRFAPYKRAGLLYKDVQRLRRILASTDRPVRILVAGKAHPRDGHGQDILKGIANLARGDDLSGLMLFVEDYDMDLARALVQGVDVWLNNPTRMKEASGTSGMKVSANGGLNLSIADGWWPEAADGMNGWTIADRDRVYDDQALQDEYDATVLYRLLEEEMVPLFFDRNQAGVPEAWMQRVVHNLETIPPHFSTDRMVDEYLAKAYRPLAENSFELRADRARAQRIADRIGRVRRAFADVKVVEARLADLGHVSVGDTVDAWIQIDLGSLSSDEVLVELVYGNAPSDDELHNLVCVELEPTGEGDGSVQTFSGSHRIERSGRYAQGLRIRPRGLTVSPNALRELALWA